jgi:hypothetical protein
MNAKDLKSAQDSRMHSDRAAPSLWSRMKAKTARALAIASIAAIAGGGCVFNAAGLDPVEISDAGDGGAKADAGHDGGGVNPPDSGTHDAGPVPDAGKPDSGVEHDAGIDSGAPDSGSPDAGPVACPGAATGSYSGYVNKSTPKLIGGYDFLYMGETSAGSGIGVLDIICHSGSAPIVAGLQCPNSTTTTYDVTVDGKRITVIPYAVAGTSMGATINVTNYP